MSIKLTNVVLASPEQMEFIIEGMRNPMNSWEKSDSEYETAGYDIVGFDLGENDHSLMQRLSNAGTEHRKYMRMMPVYVRITAPLYWWKEFDTYKVGTVANSCSTMHKIAEKEFTLEDFSTEHLMDLHDAQNSTLYSDWNGPLPMPPYGILYKTIEMLNICREYYLKLLNMTEKDFKESEKPSCVEHGSFNEVKKRIWWQLIQLLPSSYNQTRNVMLNYEVLANIYRQRKGHKLDEWREVCKWIESLPYSELIVDGEEIKYYSDNKEVTTNEQN